MFSESILRIENVMFKTFPMYINTLFMRSYRFYNFMFINNTKQIKKINYFVIFHNYTSKMCLIKYKTFTRV